MPAGSRADRAGLLLVTVTSPGRRLDLQLPGWLPPAELLPGLVRGLDLPVDGTWRLVTAEGHALDDGLGLAGQGVMDGSVLAMVAAHRDPVVHDDPAEGMAEAVEAVLPSVSGRHLDRVAGAAVLGLLLLGLAGLLLADRPPLAAGVAGMTGGLLLGAASRGAGGPWPAGVLVVLSAGYVATGGALVGSTAPVAGLPVALGGTGVALIGVATVLMSPRHRALGWVLIVLGVLTSLGGAARAVVPLDPVPALVGLTVLAVVGETLLPWWAVPEVPETAGLHRQVVVGHRRLLVGTATVGCVTVATVGWVVSTGPSGVALAAAASCAVLLRGRRQRAAPVALTGIVAGVTAMLVTIGATMWVHADARLPAALLAVLAAAVAAGWGRFGSAARREHLLEVLHAGALVSLVPLGVLAAGLLDLVEW